MLAIIIGNQQKSSDSPSQHSHQHQTVFNEDLQKKIEENERIHMQFFEADEKHRQTGVLLRERLEVLETEGAQHQAEVDGLTQKYMESIEKLQNDQTRLEARHPLSIYYQQQLKKCHAELNSRLGEATSVVQEKVPFNDTKHWQYNTLNVPPHNRRHQLKARDIVGQTLMFIQDLVAALLNFHTYTEQRVQIYPIDSATDTISPLNQKFSQYLHKNAAYVRPLEEGMLHLFDSITEDTVTTLDELTTTKRSYEDQLSMKSDHLCSMNETLTKQREEIDTLKMGSKDELTTTKRSYEDQLSMMSDHLCSMNETLTKQREEIDTLKMGSKGNSKKSKSR
ncbi:UNVERIFIED_CONTAM: hypothetical protein FKN15_074075 [Acipenser sinensis]